MTEAEERLDRFIDLKLDARRRIAPAVNELLTEARAVRGAGDRTDSEVRLQALVATLADLAAEISLKNGSCTRDEFREFAGASWACACELLDRKRGDADGDEGG